MRIGMILPSRFPPDIRVEKEIGSLRSEHEVGLLCLRRRGEPTSEDLQGVQVRRVFSDRERRWTTWQLLTSCRSELWSRAIAGFVEEFRPDVVHVHDLPLLGPALEVADRAGIPVVADLHENYPAMLAERHALPLWHKASLGAWAYRLFASIDRWREYERQAVSRADRVITVIEEARDRLVGIGVGRGRVHIVANYASLDKFDGPEVHDGRAFRVIYAGSFGPTRDLETVVSAVARIPRRDYGSLHVELVGGSGFELKRLRRAAEREGVEDRVSVRPWLPLSEVQHKMANAHVGLVPHVKSEHTDATIPHKLFQYMWRRLPVIVSDCAPLQRIVNDSGCGLAYQNGSAAGLADCLIRLYDDRELTAQMGHAGHAAVRDRYNWEQAARELRNVYESL